MEEMCDTKKALNSLNGEKTLLICIVDSLLKKIENVNIKPNGSGDGAVSSIFPSF